MHKRRLSGFTIVELLVVVSIIALLIGILLPAIGRARDQARLTLSQTNLRQLGQAHATYAAEWNDRQFTLVNDGLSKYGGNAASAVPAYNAANGGCPNDAAPGCHPGIILGWTFDETGGYGLYGFWMNWPGNFELVEPINFDSGFGWFRLPNAKQFNQYVSGRYHDPVFYAPKDRVPVTQIEPFLDHPGEYVASSEIGNFVWSSYCLSPAALYSPDVMRNADDGGFQDPWDVPGGFRVPSASQALYPELKTHMLEHHWLQQQRADCNPGFQPGTYDGCEPYYFNLGFESVPVTLFYDGHVEGLGVRQARAASSRNEAQVGYKLWANDTPFGNNGYFQDLSYDVPTGPEVGTSFHVLTTDGIRGRDKVK